MKSTINRKKFLQLSGVAILAGISGLWYKLISTEKKLSINKIFTANLNPNKPIIFYPECIIVTNADQISVFSSHCSHLGCAINETKNGNLVCPCHGSSFDENGNPVKGPAIKPLKKLDFQLDNDVISIYL